MSKEMKNVEIVKINPYEIAKASDMDEGFRSIIDNFSTLTHYLFGYHTPKTEKNMQGVVVEKQRSLQDFIIGGGLEMQGGSGALHLLPIIAFNRFTGLIVSNGYNYDGSPMLVQLGEGSASRNDDVANYILKKYEGHTSDIQNEKCCRIVSIYIGLNKMTDTQNTLESTSQDNIKDGWVAYEKEWRANALGADAFLEVNKKQTQAVKLYSLMGDIAFEPYDAKPRTLKGLNEREREVWKSRIKIAEVLVSYIMENESSLCPMMPLEKDDIRFVTATQYWDDSVDNAKVKDAKWVKKVVGLNNKEGEGFIYRPGGSLEQHSTFNNWKRAEEEAAFRAEHYNYRWRGEEIRTYRLATIAEINERLFAIRKKDGSLKEEIIQRSHINLKSIDDDINEALRGEHIYVAHQNYPDIPLQYPPICEYGEDGMYPILKENPKNKISIKGSDKISGAFKEVGEALRNSYKRTDTIDKELNDKVEKEEKERILNDKNIIAFMEDGLKNERNERVEADEKEKRERVEADNTEREEREEADDNLRLFINDSIHQLLLYTKVIDTEVKFKDWITGKYANDSFIDNPCKIVYIIGTFLHDGILDFKHIGTDKIIGLQDKDASSPHITLKITQPHPQGILGYKDKNDNIIPSISDCHLEIQGVGEENGRERWFVGIKDVEIHNCPVTVMGHDGFTLGTSVIGFESCNVKCDSNVRVLVNIRGGNGINYTDQSETGDGANGGLGGHVTVFSNCHSIENVFLFGNGGNGGNGRKGKDATGPIYANGWNGGNGGHGGNVKVFDNCSNYTQVTCEVLQGGHGGIGRDGGRRYTATQVKTKRGRGGNGGNGGDIFLPSDVIIMNNENIKGGDGRACGEGDPDGVWGVNGQVHTV